MSDLILPSVVTALAHTKLREAGIALRNKLTATNFDVRHPELVSVRTAPVIKSRTEQDVLALVEAGRRLLAGHTPAPVPGHVDIAGVGKYAILGSTGFAWPDYAAHFVRQPVGRSSAMRTGSADADFSAVYVPSTHFALRVGRLARDEAANAEERAEIGAFAAGMLSTVAHDFVLGPVIRGLRADQNTTRHTRTSMFGVKDAGQQSMQALFGGAQAAGIMQSWWPDPAQIPDALYDGYLAALGEVYGFLDEADAPGLREFLKDFDGLAEVTPERLRAGVQYLSSAANRSSWGFGTWYAAFIPTMVAVPLSLLVGRYLAPASGTFAAVPSPSALGSVQLYSLAAGIASITPFALSMHAWAEVLEHDGVFISSLVVGIARLISAGAAVGFAAGDLEGGAIASVAALAGTDVYTLVRGFVELGLGLTPEASLNFINSMPFVFGLIAIGCGAIFTELDQQDELDFWIPWAIIAAVMAALGTIPAALLTGAGGLTGLFDPKADAALPVLSSIGALAAARPRATAATFDDSTLTPITTMLAPGGTDRLTAMIYPADSGAAVKVWWEGDGDLTIEHDANSITLRVDGADRPPIVLRSDQASSADVAALLVADLEGVRAAVVNPGLHRQLAYPEVVNDPGDGEATREQHDEKASAPQPVGTSADDAYVLRTAPGANIATRVGASLGQSQPEPLDLAPSGRDTDDSAVGIAADLAAMLVAGASPSFDAVSANGPSLPTLADDRLSSVYQVLRNWNLDERRLNEWRAVVSGGAAVEKIDPATHDASMRPLETGAPAYSSAAFLGDDLLNDMGWVPTWRAWLRMASDVTADPTSSSPERYTPVIERRDGRVAAPTNAELTTAIRFLFDLR